MARSHKLLLTENVDNLGIVGDVVSVRSGYARNFLLPRRLATVPTEEAIQAVAARRAEAQRQLAELRKHREELVGKMAGLTLELVRSCNDQGILYASVTQDEIAKLLVEKGFAVRPRDVRIGANIKRVDTYDVTVKFESDLQTHIALKVLPDRKLDLEKEEPPAPAEVEPPAEGAPAPEESKPKSKGKKDAKPEGEAKPESKADAKGKTEGKPEGKPGASFASKKVEKAADKPAEKSEKAGGKKKSKE